MKFSTLTLLFLLLSCSPHYTKIENRKPYSSTGLAYIFNNYDFDNKIIKKKLNNDLLEISHKNLKTGTLIKLINPKTKEYLVLKNTKKIDYPDFYKILITRTVANKLNIHNDLPIIEVIEVKKNEKARKPSLVVKVDFGKEIGIKQSSAQITHYYNAESLVGKQVIGVCNFPTKNIAGVVSEVLVLGAIEKDGKVVLVHPSQKTDNGLDIA